MPDYTKLNGNALKLDGRNKNLPENKELIKP